MCTFTNTNTHTHIHTHKHTHKHRRPNAALHSSGHDANLLSVCVPLLLPDRGASGVLRVRGILVADSELFWDVSVCVCHTHHHSIVLFLTTLHYHPPPLLSLTHTHIHRHYDEGFSSLRNKDYKNFLRFRIDRHTGDLECFGLGFTETPTQWVGGVWSV
jgi:hypothetical protein